jgi:hypothetical protein
MVILFWVNLNLFAVLQGNLAQVVDIKNLALFIDIFVKFCLQVERNFQYKQNEYKLDADRSCPRWHLIFTPKHNELS